MPGRELVCDVNMFINRGLERRSCQFISFRVIAVSRTGTMLHAFMMSSP